MSITITDVPCTICGCVCDDLEITVSDGHIVEARRACSLAEPWFLHQSDHAPPAVTLRGAEVSQAEGLDAAAEHLRHSRSPLIYGLSRGSTEGQRSAVALAEWLGGTVDTTASHCHAESIQALQAVGEATCSLGEIRNRADLVIYWGSNPAVSHPRHGERYATHASGRWISGRDQRYVVVADVDRTASADEADLFLPIERGADFRALWALRQMIHGGPLDEDRCGAPPELLRQLAERMKNCRCGIVFFGIGLTHHNLGHQHVEALLLLVRDLNRYTRFYARRMRIQGDVAGADSVLCWQTGYPFSVNFSRGYPRYNPGEFSANDLLERDEVDAVVLVGSEGTEWFSEAARERLQQLPIIALDYPMVESKPVPTVRFTTAVYGIHLPGTAYRMDEVPLPLKVLLPTNYPSDAEILDGLLARLR